MNSTHSYDREGFLDEFFPDPDERADVEAGARQLVNRSADQGRGASERLFPNRGEGHEPV